jgi:hypothetical protein
MPGKIEGKEMGEFPKRVNGPTPFVYYRPVHRVISAGA